MRLAKFIFLMILLFLPTQLGKHFWPQFSYVLGQRVDYLSPTLYLTDILIAALFLLEIKKILPFLKRKFSLFLFFSFFVFLFSLFWLTFPKQTLGLLIYKWVKLFEFLFVVFWVKNNVKTAEVYLPLSFGILWESVLTGWQFFHQHSLGLWFLGERHFNTATPGIALAGWRQGMVLRPYATFPHPNVLAGYTLVILILNLFSKYSSRFWRFLTLFLGTVTIFLSFSRGTWLTCLFILGFWFWQKRATTLLPSWLFLNLSQETVWRRIDLAQATWQMVKHSPILGVGLGNFIPQLPHFLTPKKLYFWQPVHNIFLLVLAELGMVGLGLMVVGLGSVLKRLWQRGNFALFYPLLAIILTGFFDHYWLTLQQTQLLLALIIGFSLQNDSISG